MAPRMPAPVRSGTLVLPTGDQTYVYRAYCLCGDLLYVGITGNLFTRLSGHARARAEWERKAVRLEWDMYATRGQAERVETYLIRALDPTYNTLGRSAAHRRTRWQDLPEPVFRDPGETPQERLFARARRLSVGAGE